MCSALPTFREPWNITCSKRWAKPVLPSTSCFEPTSYQRLIATTGASRSTEMIRRRPLASRSSVKDTVGTLGIGWVGLLGGSGSPIVGPTGIRWIDGVDMSIFRLLDIRLTRPDQEATTTMAARPAVRRSAGRPADVPTRPVVRDLTRGGVSYRIDWDVRTAFDFVFSLSGRVRAPRRTCPRPTANGASTA